MKIEIVPRSNAMPNIFKFSFSQVADVTEIII